MNKGVTNKATAEEAAKVLLAWANGEIIEFRSSSTSPWTSADLTGQLSWNFDFFEYRIKPELRTVWVACSQFTISDLTWQTKEECDEKYPDHTWKTVKFVEVIE